MSRFIHQKQGFTLIELMVVIVIIGVLASLAIPRFSEASDKAKMAEAPRILASFESAYLAGKAELGDSVKTMEDIIFDTSAIKSRWFTYKPATVNNMIGAFGGKTKGKIGKITANNTFFTQDSVNTGVFVHCFDGKTAPADYAGAKKYVPNFLTAASLPGGCTATGW
jgi:prepilin-type N-terminal cleavage/methylation domain-containing protein